MRRIAIGCQGGGSHTAFTCGALAAIIREQLAQRDFEIVALSGTSGGAIGALLAWYGLIEDGGDAALERLDRFWRDGFPHGGAARLLPDRIANAAYVASLRQPVVTAEVSPYAGGRVLDTLPGPARAQLQPWLDAQAGLRAVVQDFVDFSRIPELVARDRRRHELFVGAVEVLSGRFVAFRGTDPAFTVDAVVASGTLPEISRATVIEFGPYAGVYWDGLYSQNPPIREFFRLGDDDPANRPDEIWLIRINPRTRDAEPQSPRDIFDRRNELAGNLSLEQELEHARFVNQLVAACDLSRQALATTAGADAVQHFEDTPVAAQIRRCTPVGLPDPIMMSPAVADHLDYASKFNRDPAFLEMLIAHGTAQARAFVQRWRSDRTG